MSQFGDYIKAILTFVVVLVIAGFVVSLGLWIAGVFDDKGNEARTTLASVDDIKYTPYDNTTVVGSEVLDAVRKFEDDLSFAIFIRTGNNPAGFYAENKSIAPAATIYTVPASGNVVGAPTTTTTSTMVSISEMKDSRNHLNYVNPTGRFRAELYYDANSAVRMIVFTQR